MGFWDGVKGWFGPSPEEARRARAELERDDRSEAEKNERIERPDLYARALAWEAERGRLEEEIGVEHMPAEYLRHTREVEEERERLTDFAAEKHIRYDEMLEERAISRLERQREKGEESPRHDGDPAQEAEAREELERRLAAERGIPPADLLQQLLKEQDDRDNAQARHREEIERDRERNPDLWRKDPYDTEARLQEAREHQLTLEETHGRRKERGRELQEEFDHQDRVQGMLGEMRTRELREEARRRRDDEREGPDQDDGPPEGGSPRRPRDDGDRGGPPPPAAAGREAEERAKEEREAEAREERRRRIEADRERERRERERDDLGLEL